MEYPAGLHCDGGGVDLSPAVKGASCALGLKVPVAQDAVNYERLVTEGLVQGGEYLSQGTVDGYMLQVWILAV